MRGVQNWGESVVNGPFASSADFAARLRRHPLRSCEFRYDRVNPPSFSRNSDSAH